MYPIRHRFRFQHSGFTLVEVAVVLAVVATLLGTLLVPLSTQVRATKIKSTDESMEEVREALLGFAMSNGRLPCPDTDLDGREDPLAPCASVQGFLPFVTLGVRPADAWGRLFTYRVTLEFAKGVNPGLVCKPLDTILGLCDVGNILVNDRVDATKVFRTLGNAAIAVVVSHGPNGNGATDLNGVALPAPTGADELENTDINFDFVLRTMTPASSACSETDITMPYCEFDDRVIWLSSNVLFNRLVTAGVLP